MYDQFSTSVRTRSTSGSLHAHVPPGTVTMEPQGGEEMETRVLQNLVDAFPGFALDDIAQAYTDSDSDVNAAAILLASRHPSMSSTGLLECWTNSREMNGYSNQSAEQLAVKSDDLLLEKYGRGVGELINQRQSTFLIHNLQSTHDEASRNAFRFNNRTANDLRGDNKSGRAEVVNKVDSCGVSGDGALLVRRKKTKQTGGAVLDTEVEVADAKRQHEEFLVSMIGRNSELDIEVIRDILGSLKGDPRESVEVLLQMSSSTSPQSHNVDSTINQDERCFDDKYVGDRGHSHFQRTESHVDKAPVPTSMEYMFYACYVQNREDFCDLRDKEGIPYPYLILIAITGPCSPKSLFCTKCRKAIRNGRSLVPNCENIANGSTQRESIKDKIDLDQYEVSLKQLKECFPHVHEANLLYALQEKNFVLSDAVELLLDLTADRNLTSCPTDPNVGLGDRANTINHKVLKENGPFVTAPPPPLKAAWTDVNRIITPLTQMSTDVKHGSTENAVEGKNESSGDVDDYGRFRLDAHGHWRMMDYYFKEAAAAYNRGERCRAATLAEKGKEFKQLAQEADGRASQRLFQSRNKDIVNNITIDLHAQHVHEAINVLRRHLQTLCSIPSVHMLTVITGYGSHSINGRAKIKPAVTNFLSRSGIPWEELNEGCLTVKMLHARNKELNVSDGEKSGYW